MRGINLLHPELKVICLKWIEECKKARLKISLLDTLRTETEQNNIPAENTKAKFPRSMHNWGLAFDFCIMKNGKIDWKDINSYKKAGEIGKKLGLFWGGDFKSIKGDFGHLQLNKFGLTADLIKKYNRPSNFIRYPK